MATETGPSLQTINEEEEEWAEIEDDEVPEDPQCVHGPDYPVSSFKGNANKIENPKYDGDYGKPQENYHYIDVENLGTPVSLRDFRTENSIEKPNYSDPLPVPTSLVSYSRTIPALDKMIIFLFHYWHYFLIALGALILFLVLTMIAFLVFIKPGGSVTIRTTPIYLTAQSPRPLNCANNFIKVNSKCWKLSDYETTLSDAKTKCQALDSHMVTVKSTKENNSLEEFIGNFSSSWIGLACDSNNVSQCQWDDGLNITGDEYSNFAMGNPWYQEGCSIYFSKSDSKWYSDLCNVNLRSYVCEYE